MVPKEKLYEAFGELLYALSKADGSIQAEELAVLEKILKAHPFGEQILWSFNYEAKKTNTVKDAYDKAIDTFKEHGPFEEYEKFIEILTEVAKAFGGITVEEKDLINKFRSDLLNTFLDDDNLR